MQREIGSNFWLDPHESMEDKPIGTPAQFGCNGSDYVWLSTGRSAIKMAIKTIEERKPNLKKSAILPSFTCDTVFQPLIESGYEVNYYPIGKDLRTTSNDILETAFAHEASLVLFHRYFGFDTLDNQDDDLCEELRASGIFTIEDCTQNLYSRIHRSTADFFVGSIRKWTGTPDGGFTCCRNGYFSDKPTHPDKELEKAKIKASYAKYNYLFNHFGDKSDMLALYRCAEDVLDHQEEIYSISESSIMVQANLDRSELINKRRRNFSVLQEGMCNSVTPLFNGSLVEETPLYFPVYVDDRLSLQRHLAQNAIYAPVVWPKDESQAKQCEGAENAYEHLLCIPIDQRYDEEDMNRIIDVINNFYSK